jgi:hypothetical protein
MIDRLTKTKGSIDDQCEAGKAAANKAAALYDGKKTATDMRRLEPT